MINLGSTIRAVTAEQTLKKLDHSFLLNTFGITRIANITGLDDIGIPTYLCIRPNAKCLSVSQGKGASDNLAKISAIMESIEFWHAENIENNPCVIKNKSLNILHGSYYDLRRDFPLLLDDSLFTNLIRHNDICTQEIRWIKMHDLLSGEFFYIPLALISMNYADIQPDQRFFTGSSNGLASGNTKDEAIIHALYELIERDCIYHQLHLNHSSDHFPDHSSNHHSSDDNFRYNAPSIDQKSIASSLCKKLISKIRAANYELSLWNITNAIGIPAYKACIDDQSHWRGIGACYGHGAHYYHDIALARAITEAAQSRLTIISGSREDIPLTFYSQNPEKFSNQLPEKTSLFNNTTCAETVLNKSITFKQHLDIALNRLVKTRHISHVLVYDHTRADIQIPVVSVVIPGLKLQRFPNRII